MTVICGIDASTIALDLVCVDIDTLQATWTHCPLRSRLSDDGLETSDLWPAASVRDALPGPSWFEDQHVEQIAIEDPFSNRLDTAKKLGRIVGAVAARLPRDIPTLLVTPVEMRQWLGLTGRMSKEQLRGWAVTAGAPEDWEQDALDAYCVARAATLRLDRAAA